MADFATKATRYRALLTETLPYEVPIIFSNDRFFQLLTRSWDSDVEDLILKLIAPLKGHSIPYSYQIRKGQTGTTTLSIINPLAQIELAQFYVTHTSAILAGCSRSKFSIRRPASVAQKFSDFKIENETSSLKSGTVQQAPDEFDISHIVSFFSYERFNLLGKFVESREFTLLEKKYFRLRTIDISKCFFNIYTHSITWAVKDKEFAKENRNAYSFEGEFDRLMQKANYNETNGIVIGPEFSRIFAEIILQAVDRVILSKLSSHSLEEGVHYCIRRYVDDYYIFANKDEDLNLIEATLRKELEFYKLFINEKKITDQTRPFVSQLTLARAELQGAISDIRGLIQQDLLPETLDDFKEKRRALSQILRRIRLVVAQHKVEVGNISGWLLAVIRNLVRLISLKLNKNDTLSNEILSEVSSAIIQLIHISFYLCALDLRVRTTYLLSQIILFIRMLRRKVPDHFEMINYTILEQLASLVVDLNARLDPDTDNIELFNLLICGAHFIGVDFVRKKEVSTVIERLLASNEITYFKFITLKFCLLKDAKLNAELNSLNGKVLRKLLQLQKEVRLKSELYLLFIDFLASNDVGHSEKREILTEIFGGQYTNAAISKLPDLLGFCDWTGLQVKHLLRRKELRPVYSWA